MEYGAPGVFPLPMGIGREDGHERESGSTDLQGVQGSISALNLGPARLLERPNLR